MFCCLMNTALNYVTFNNKQLLFADVIASEYCSLRQQAFPVWGQQSNKSSLDAVSAPNQNISLLSVFNWRGERWSASPRVIHLLWYVQGERPSDRGIAVLSLCDFFAPSLCPGPPLVWVRVSGDAKKSSADTAGSAWYRNRNLAFFFLEGPLQFSWGS